MTQLRFNVFFLNVTWGLTRPREKGWYMDMQKKENDQKCTVTTDLKKGKKPKKTQVNLLKLATH